MKKPKDIKTTVKDVTDFPGGIQADVVIHKGGGTKGKWTIGWSRLVGGIVMVYDDGQIISARTNGLFETMCEFRKPRTRKKG
ncbi:hypothetical protein LCGC14_3041480, partial [marine sediment metagenome]